MHEIVLDYYKNLIYSPYFGENRIEVCNYISKMLQNNLNTFKALDKYITFVNVLLDKWDSDEHIVSFLKRSDYNSRLYFYACSMLELALYNCDELERNKEIKEGTKNAEIIKKILGSTDDKLNANLYVDKNELQLITYTVFSNMYSKNSPHQFSFVLKEFLKIYEINFGDKLSIPDVYINLLKIQDNAISKEYVQYELKKLNNDVKSCGGIFKNVKPITPSKVELEVDKMGQVLEGKVMDDYIQVTNATTKCANSIGLAEYSELNEKCEFVNQLQMNDKAM